MTGWMWDLVQERVEMGFGSLAIVAWVMIVKPF
jgi:hypothetical protein